MSSGKSSDDEDLSIKYDEDIPYITGGHGWTKKASIKYWWIACVRKLTPIKEQFYMDKYGFSTHYFSHPGYKCWCQQHQQLFDKDGPSCRCKLKPVMLRPQGNDFNELCYHQIQNFSRCRAKDKSNACSEDLSNLKDCFATYKKMKGRRDGFYHTFRENIARWTPGWRVYPDKEIPFEYGTDGSVKAKTES